MLLRLLLLFTVVPIVELALLIWIGKHLGVAETVALVLITGMAGASLARHQGLRTIRQIQEELAAGAVPGEALLQGAMILMAGALLVTPGVLTDLLGLCLLVPPIRGRFSRHLMAYLRTRIHVVHTDWEEGPRPRRHVDTRVTPVEREDDNGD